jgi:hypothetical protein
MRSTEWRTWHKQPQNVERCPSNMPQDDESGRLHFHLMISFVDSAYTNTLLAHCHGVFGNHFGRTV